MKKGQAAYRGITIDGLKVRQLRRLLSWNQCELGHRAGVSERTVRNAEKSGALDVSVAGYLAKALGVALSEIVFEPNESNQEHYAVRFAREFDRAYELAITQMEFDLLLDLVHPDVQWHCISNLSTKACGEFSQIEGLKNHCYAVHSWLTSEGYHNRGTTFRQIHRDGELLYLHGLARFQTIGKSSQNFWFAKVLRMTGEKIRFVDQFFGEGIRID